MRRFKKVVASVSVTALGVAALAGCTRAPKATSMFDVMKSASEVKKGTYEVSCTIEQGDEVVDFTIYGDYENNSATMSVKAMANGVKYEIEDAVILTESAAYVNVSSISTIAGAADFDLSAYGITGDWISIDLGEAVQAEADADADVFYDALDKAYKDVIEEEDGKYEIRISSDEDLQNFIDATIVLLNDNSADWSKEIADTYNQIDYEAIVRNVITGLLTDVNKYLDAGVSEDEIDDIIDEAMSETDFSELTVDASEYEEMFEDFASELEAAKDEISFEDSGIDKMAVTTYQEDKSYVVEAEMVGMMDDEKCSIKVSSTITKDDSVSVKAPTENVQTISEAVCGMLDAFGITADDIDEYLGEFEDMGDLSGSLYDDYSLYE